MECENVLNTAKQSITHNNISLIRFTLILPIMLCCFIYHQNLKTSYHRATSYGRAANKYSAKLLASSECSKNVICVVM